MHLASLAGPSLGDVEAEPPSLAKLFGSDRENASRDSVGLCDVVHGIAGMTQLDDGDV